MNGGDAEMDNSRHFRESGTAPAKPYRVTRSSRRNQRTSTMTVRNVEQRFKMNQQKQQTEQQQLQSHTHNSASHSLCRRLPARSVSTKLQAYTQSMASPNSIRLLPGRPPRQALASEATSRPANSCAARHSQAAIGMSNTRRTCSSAAGRRGPRTECGRRAFCACNSFRP